MKSLAADEHERQHGAGRGDPEADPEDVVERADERRGVDAAAETAAAAGARAAAIWCWKIAPSAGDPGRDPDLPERRVDPRGDAGLLAAHGRDRGRRERRVDEPDADPADDEAGQQHGPVGVRLTPVISASETATQASPPPISSRTGTCAVSFPEIGATKNASSVIGRKRSPACSGE